MTIEPTDEMRDAFSAARAEHDGVPLGRFLSGDEVGLRAALAILERDQAGPCSAMIPPAFGVTTWLWCQLRHGHTGDHESGPTRWKDIQP